MFGRSEPRAEHDGTRGGVGADAHDFAAVIGAHGKDDVGGFEQWRRDGARTMRMQVEAVCLGGLDHEGGGAATDELERATRGNLPIELASLGQLTEPNFAVW